MGSCRFLSLLNRRAVRIKNVAKTRFPDAVEFMRSNYIDDPLMRSMGITARHKDTDKFLSALWLAYLKSDLSLAGVNGSKICGLSVNAPMSTDDGKSNPILVELSKTVKTNTTRNLIYAWQRMDKETTFPKGKRILELAGLAVGFRDRGKGIARELVQSSADLAKLSGFDYFRVNCTNPMTAKICDELGWERVLELPFDKFEGASTNPALVEEFKDFSVKVYVASLKGGTKND